MTFELFRTTWYLCALCILFMYALYKNQTIHVVTTTLASSNLVGPTAKLNASMWESKTSTAAKAAKGPISQTKICWYQTPGMIPRLMLCAASAVVATAEAEAWEGRTGGHEVEVVGVYLVYHVMWQNWAGKRWCRTSLASAVSGAVAASLRDRGAPPPAGTRFSWGTAEAGRCCHVDDKGGAAGTRGHLGWTRRRSTVGRLHRKNRHLRRQKTLQQESRFGERATPTLILYRRREKAPEHRRR